MKTPCTESTAQSAPSKRNFNGKSTATAAQYQRVLAMLRTGEKSTFDFRREGVIHPAMRIKELNEKHGYTIPRIALRDLWDAEGYLHPRIAIYELQGEPDTQKAGTA